MNSKVSCICSTYGRPHVLREAIQSFLDQDYPNKELIILNDNVGYPLECKEPNVKIINLNARCKSLGEKRNICVSLCSLDTEFICIFEDDDLSTPWRITQSVNILKEYPQFDMVKSIIAIGSIDNNNYHISGNSFEGSACWRASYLKNHKYNENLSVHMDLEMESKAICFHHNPSPEFWYVYRWGCGVYHLSGAGIDDSSNWERAAQIKNDDQNLIIGYDHDYWSDIGLFLKADHPLLFDKWNSKFLP